MQQRLVAWGDIGTDHKALLAIEFDATAQKVRFHAFPEETVNLELQHRLFTIWKNGGEFEFPMGITSWETDTEYSHIMPENIKLHKPELLVQAQEQWNKLMELENNFKLMGERLHLLELELDGIQSFNQDLWNKTKALWEEISELKRDGSLGWTHADELKIRINGVFDGLKAFRRLNKEKNYDESQALATLFKKQVRECAEKLVYPDEWKNIFKSLQGIQKQMKDAPLLYKHRRTLMKQINDVFNDLRNYRKADQLNHIEDRLKGLERVLFSLDRAIERDESSYKNQFEKLKHYTRGKMSDEEIEAQLKHIKDSEKDKHKKVKSIRKTMRTLEKKLEALKNPPEPKPKKEKPAKDKQKAKKKSGEKDASAGKVADDQEQADEKTRPEKKKAKASKPAKEKDDKKSAEPMAETVQQASESEVDASASADAAETVKPEVTENAQAADADLSASETAGPVAGSVAETQIGEAGDPEPDAPESPEPTAEVENETAVDPGEEIAEEEIAKPEYPDEETSNVTDTADTKESSEENGHQEKKTAASSAGSNEGTEEFAEKSGEEDSSKDA